MLNGTVSYKRRGFIAPKRLLQSVFYNFLASMSPTVINMRCLVIVAHFIRSGMLNVRSEIKVGHTIFAPTLF